MKTAEELAKELFNFNYPEPDRCVSFEISPSQSRWMELAAYLLENYNLTAKVEVLENPHLISSTGL